MNYDAEIGRLEHELEMAWIELGYTPECRKQGVQNRINALMAEIARLRIERMAGADVVAYIIAEGLVDANSTAE